MFPRPSFVLLLCVVVNINLSSSKPQNSSAKPVDKANPQAGQSFVVNNNCGLEKTDREMMAYIKAKVDHIAEQSSKGKAFSILLAVMSTCSIAFNLVTKKCYLALFYESHENAWNEAVEAEKWRNLASKSEKLNRGCHSKNNFSK